MRQQGHRAMRARAHGDAGAVDHRRDVMRMGPIHIEGENRPLSASPSIDAQALDFRQPLMRIGGQIGLVGADRGAAKALHVIERGAEPTAWAIGGVPASNRCGGLL